MTAKSDVSDEQTIETRVSQIIDRPIEDVFDFYAVDHVRNHPRWDPDVELEKETPGPIGVGTVIRRRNTRYEEPVEGTIEITEYEPNEAMGAVIREGGFEMPGRATFEPRGPSRTELSIGAEFPTSFDEDMILSKMERSARNIKELVEAEYRT